MGAFEIPQFSDGTKSLAAVLAGLECNNSYRRRIHG